MIRTRGSDVRWVELRRHSYTKKGGGRGHGSSLSQEGVDAARGEAKHFERVSYVAVSESPRTLETAIAMGFAVDDVVGIAGSNTTGEVEFHEWWDWPNPWAVYADRITCRPTLADYAAAQLDIVRHAVSAVDEGHSALLVGLEGVRLSVEDGRFEVAAVRRRP